ncbi:MAG: hypothetical protein IJS28_07415 [Synergistaceae bacterium]|nr:hypothetical protein [Synergistaceae bacterium]
MYYVNYDEDTGEILGIYPSSESYDDVPYPKITITDEEYERLGSGEWTVRDNALQLVSEEPTPSAGSVEVLQTEYAEKFARLRNSYTGAEIMGDRTNTADIQRDYRLLIDDFKAALAALDDGQPYEGGAHEHCEICGARLNAGECLRCHWRL